MPRSRRFVLDILPQTNDKVVDSASVSVFAQAPDIFEDRAARNDAPVVVDQIAKQLGFHQRQMHGLLTGPKLQRVEVDRLVAESDDVAGISGRFRRGITAVAAKPLTPPQQRMNASEQD